jgi:hypothetical protein
MRLSKQVQRVREYDSRKIQCKIRILGARVETPQRGDAKSHFQKMKQRFGGSMIELNVSSLNSRNIFLLITLLLRLQPEVEQKLVGIFMGTH